MLSFVGYIKALLLDIDIICGYCPLHEVSYTPIICAQIIMHIMCMS